VAVFRLALAVFGIAVLIFAVRFVLTGERRYLRWAVSLLLGALAFGVLFFAVLLVSRFA